MENLKDYSINHTNNLVNLGNSLLAHYGVKPFHPTIKEVDELLKGHKKVAVFLLDGLGKAVLEKHKGKSKFFLDNRYCIIHSVNPATTVAATTSFLSGKYPIETGWLGWTMYIKEFDRGVCVFPNVFADTHEKVEGWDYHDVNPVKKFQELLTEVGVKAFELYPNDIRKDGYSDDKNMFYRADKFFNDGGEFLYAYNINPDHTMHKLGPSHRKVGRVIKKFGKNIKKFAKAHPDVLTLVIADHGMVEVADRDIAAFPELTDLIEKTLYLEGRTATFFIKEGKKEEFKEKFDHYFPFFALITREEALEKGYFGEGEPHERSLDTIGDFVAIAMNEDLLGDSRSAHFTYFAGHHAGGTKEELEIQVTALNR